MKNTIKQLLMTGSVMLSTSVFAATYTLPEDGSDVVGEMKMVYSEPGDSLTKLGIRHEVGYNEITKANPTLSRKKLRAGTPVIIPTAHVIPDVERQGIVINLSDMRLYYFPTPEQVVAYPVAIGKSGWSTPQGTTYIKQKKRHPTWTPPASIRREAAKRGRKLRSVYPAGPNNPLGTRALRLGMSGYLIHGTNKPWTIGQRRSHGCIRMRRNDVEALFEQVSVGLPVKIIKVKSRQLALPETLAQELQAAKDKQLADIAANQANPIAVKTAVKTVKKRKPYRKKVVRKSRKPRKQRIETPVVKHNIPKKYLIPADVFQIKKTKVKSAKNRAKAVRKVDKSKRKIVPLGELLSQHSQNTEKTKATQ